MKRVFGWLSVAALTLLMAAPSAQARPRHWRGHGGGGGGFSRVAEMLNLTPQQREAIRKIRYDSKREMIRARAELQLARLDLRQLTEKHRPNLAKVSAAIDKVGALELKLKKSRILMMLKMKALLTPEQAAKAAELRRQRRARWGGRRGWKRRMWRRRMMERHMGRDQVEPGPGPGAPEDKGAPEKK